MALDNNTTIDEHSAVYEERRAATMSELISTVLTIQAALEALELRVTAIEEGLET